MVSTIPESFFVEHLAPWGQERLRSCNWLQLRAANGLCIPYIGYLELDVTLCGKVVPGCGILVVMRHLLPRGSWEATSSVDAIGNSLPCMAPHFSMRRQWFKPQAQSLKPCNGAIGPPQDIRETSLVPPGFGGDGHYEYLVE
ncbi:hypothetical protein N1851_021883 [Merluccius polli]|uniref:Uncharacterized protein n=1 Tax=Merluccius polli TaxID=89951 RepID=A0AA47NZ31_MERPO|nr:hypothetical protein N1851_021883 [Merluccius polli]